MSAARTCYLHVGTPKTGSTTIQGFLHLYRDRLQAAGVDVPLFGASDVIAGGVKIAAALTDETNPDAPETEAWRSLDRHLAESRNDLILSRESFCQHFEKKRHLRFVERFFETRGVRVKYFAYLRDTPGLMSANYTQQAKRLLQTTTFGGYLSRRLVKPQRIHENFQLFGPLLASGAFTATAMTQLGSGGLIPDFLAKIDRPDFDASGFDDSPFRNETPGARTVAASVRAAMEIDERGVRDEIGKVMLARELGRLFREKIATLGWTEKPFYGPDAAMTRKIDERFHDQNEAFARKAWGRSWTDVIPPSTKAQNVYDLAAAPAAERAEIEDLAKSFVGELVASIPARRAALKKGGGRPGRVNAEFP